MGAKSSAMQTTTGILGLAAVGFLLLVLAGVVVLWLGYVLIRRLLWQATHRVLDRAVDKVVDAGVSGVSTVAKNVTDEMRKNDPRRLEAEVSRLAKGRKGRVSVSDVMADMDIAQPVAERTLQGLARRGVCQQRTEEDGAVVFLFTAFRPRRDVTLCDYCGGTFDQADATQPCPSCGATLTRKSVVE